MKIFKDFSAELGDPKKSLFIAKLDNPTLSFGVRKKITIINKILRKNPLNFNIYSTFDPKIIIINVIFPTTVKIDTMSRQKLSVLIVFFVSIILTNAILYHSLSYKNKSNLIR